MKANILSWTLTIILLVSLSYSALYPASGLAGVALTVMWVIIVLGWLLLSLTPALWVNAKSDDEKVKATAIDTLKKCTNKGSSIVSNIVTLTIILLAAYLGMVVTAVAYALTVIIIQIFNLITKDILNKKN